MEEGNRMVVDGNLDLNVCVPIVLAAKEDRLS